MQPFYFVIIINCYPVIMLCRTKNVPLRRYAN